MFNWREIPFVRLLFPFIIGILICFNFNYYHPVLMGVFSFLILLALFFLKPRGGFKYRWVFGTVATCFFLLLGYLSAYFHDERNADLFLGNKIIEKESLVFGTVKDAPIKKGGWVRIKMEAQAIGQDIDSLDECAGKILVYISRDSASEKIAYGDLIYFTGTPSTVNPPDNPHSFNFQRYLHFQNIHHQAFVRAGDWTILENGHGNTLFSKAIDMQSIFLGILKKYIPGEKELAVGSALILGNRDEISEEVRTAYSQTGAMHVLAVSGLHVGIIFMILNFFLKRIKINTPTWRIIKTLIGLVVIWAFALITGASPSVMRAAVMFSFLHIGLAFQRTSSIYNTLAASAFFILLYDPYLIASVGFQLSYLAVFGIVFFQPRIAELWQIKNKFGNYMWQLACVSLAAQTMTLPLTFYYFNQLPIYFWLTGLLLVPLAGLELGAGVAVLATEFIWPPLAALFGKLLYGFLFIGNAFVFYVQQLPMAVIEGIWIGGTMALLLYLFITNIMAAISSKKYSWVISGLFFLFFVSLNYAFSEIKNHKNQQIAIYKIYKHSAIDFFDGKKVFSITDMNMEEKPLGFATEGHRYAMGVESLETLHFEQEEEFLSNHLFYKNNFIQFYDIKIAVIEHSQFLPNTKDIEVDYIILRNSPKILMEELDHVFNFKKIIFDNSNKKWQVEKWKEQCGELGIEYYDIAMEGAFILDIK